MSDRDDLITVLRKAGMTAANQVAMLALFDHIMDRPPPRPPEPRQQRRRGTGH